MDNYITVKELIWLLAVLWLPIFSIAAFVHWKLLHDRRWRKTLVGCAFILGLALAPIIWLSPLHRKFIYLGDFGEFFAVGGNPLQAALLSALIVLILIFALRRMGHSKGFDRTPENPGPAKSGESGSGID